MGADGEMINMGPVGNPKKGGPAGSVADLPGRLVQFYQLNQQGLLPDAVYEAAVERAMTNHSDVEHLAILADSALKKNVCAALRAAPSRDPVFLVAPAEAAQLGLSTRLPAARGLRSRGARFAYAAGGDAETAGRLELATTATMDPHVVAELQQLKQLALSGVLTEAQAQQAQSDLLRQAALLRHGTPETSSGLPVGYKVEVHQMLGAGVLGGGAMQSQPELQQAPQLQLAPPRAAGPTAAQLAAQQQLEQLQAAQAAQLEQMQRAMNEQMEAAHSSVQLAAAAATPATAAAAATTAAAPAAGAAKSSSSGEKQAAAQQLQLPKKKSEKQSTNDPNSTAKPSSGATEKRCVS